MSAQNPATPNPTRRPYHTATASFVSGKDTPRAFLERCIGRIEELESKIGAFVTLNLAGARAAADRASERWRAGTPLSPIDGMPVGIKDIIETEDMPTEQGSPLFAGWRTNRDAATVVALKEAGAVIVGKTVTTEFASSEPRGTRNPWDLERTPGGSSSGSAASVAVGMLPSALGTQVVGSILRPSSFCGVVGFKPSVGGLNRGGSYDGMSQSCDGALSATLADAWLTCREISARAGGDPGYPGLAGPRGVPDVRTPKRLAFIETAGWPAASAEARGAFEAALAKLKTAGIAVIGRRDDAVIAEVENAIHDALDLARNINNWEGRWPLNAYRGRPGLSRASQERLAQAEAMKREDYQALIERRARVRATWAKLKTVCEAVVTLTAAGPAPIGLGSTGNPIFVVPGSVLGVPAVTLPVLEEDGLPLGFQTLGFEQEDSALFGIARGIDAVFGGKN